LAKLRKPEPRKADDARWVAVQTRDTNRDGTFYYAVATTGVYCRPSCPSRRPKRANVSFYATAAQAQAAGFRACKRCTPDRRSLPEEHAANVAEACRLIEAAAEPPKLVQLAAEVGLSPYHFHRIFKSIVGVTPKAYSVAHRNKNVRDKLQRSTTVTEAIYDAGFNSSGRFYANSTEVLGMKPKSYRAGGADEEIRFAFGDCSLGAILVAASANGVCAILLGNDRKALAGELRQRFLRAKLIKADAAFSKTLAKAIRLIEAPASGVDLPLDVRGTAFQHRVWKALQAIPAGSTSTYAEVARRIGNPKAVRAVAGACAANPVAVAIPCHRVIRADGGLAGYYWGVARKRELLDREGK
jgi:AraC family transcriptional regulator, regulatory protein of adaptative response / methylated-DNA-[protein]-cysteine methyltransferase